MHQSKTIFTGEGAINSFQNFISEAGNNYSGIFLLSDTNTRAHCLPLLSGRFNIPGNAIILEVEPGEKTKQLETCSRLWHEMAMLGADRHSLLICLGGGVVCDLGGFVASTYQRGIDFIYLPTTLLAQVDAAIGGKTGVNLHNLKNYIGLFSLPTAVFIFTEFLKTLPHKELLSGYAEVLKHALLSDEKAYRQLAKKFAGVDAISEAGDWSAVVQRSVKIKSNVVSSDPYEHGMRKVLNLGHTVGHAFESHSLKIDQSPLLHGFAVAMGLVVELRLSVHYCSFPEKLAEEVITYIFSVFPFYAFDVGEISGITSLMGFDKKNRGGNIQMTLISQPGDLMTDVTCSKDVIVKSLQEYLELGSNTGNAKSTDA
jgi:3-dehydroquinate synthase